MQKLGKIGLLSPLQDRNIVNTFSAVAVSLSRYAAPFPYASVKPDNNTLYAKNNGLDHAKRTSGWFPEILTSIPV